MDDLGWSLQLLSGGRTEAQKWPTDQLEARTVLQDEEGQAQPGWGSGPV